MSILDDMTAAAMGEEEKRLSGKRVRPLEWRIGLNGWHAFLADLHHRGIGRHDDPAQPPREFLGHPIVRVADHSSWMLCHTKAGSRLAG